MKNKFKFKLIENKIITIRKIYLLKELCWRAQIEYVLICAGGRLTHQHRYDLAAAPNRFWPSAEDLTDE